jgi:flagellar hook assembly protein FlgD
VPVGFDASDPSFDTAEETGGSKNAIVVSHTHTAESAGTHNHNLAGNDSSGEGIPTRGWTSAEGKSIVLTSASVVEKTASVSNDIIYSAGAHTHTINSTGSSGTNANLQPYITVYMWKRTA